MTAVATLSTATAADLPGLHTPGSALLWVAAAVWLLAPSPDCCARRTWWPSAPVEGVGR